MPKDIEALIINHKPVSDLMMKRMLLLFDRVHILDPNENKFLIPDKVCRYKFNNMEFKMSDYGILYNGHAYKTFEEDLINKFDYAYEKGDLCVEDLRARMFYEKYWLPLRLAYDFDTANEQLLLTSKGLLEENPNYHFEPGILRGGFVQPSGSYIYPDISQSPNIFEDKNSQLYELQAFSAIAKMDRSLILSSELDLIPAFVDENFYKMFIEKSKIVKNNSEEQLNNKFLRTNNIELQNVQQLLYSISQLIIPDEVLGNIPVKELIIARNRTFDNLYKLRRNLLSSIEFLSAEVYDEEFIKEANDFIDRKFKPELDEYNSKFIETLSKFTGYYSTFTFGSLSAFIGLSQSLTPLQIALLSGASAVVGNLTTNLADYITAKGKEKFKNTYSYFLNFKE